MNSNILVAGQIGSGKTSVSKALAQKLGYRWNSYGSTIKNIAVERDISISRKTLQSLGEALIESSSESLSRRVISEAVPAGDQPFVIDGLRHSHIPDIIRAITTPAVLIIVYIDVADALRRERLRDRDKLSDEQIDKSEQHSTEIQVATTIRGLADFIVDNSGELQSTVSEIIRVADLTTS